MIFFFLLGVRMLDGEVYDSIEAKALNYKNQFIDVMSASWGPRDDGMTMEGPGPATKDALETGVKKVRIDLNIDVCLVLLFKKIVSKEVHQSLNWNIWRYFFYWLSVLFAMYIIQFFQDDVVPDQRDLS